MALLFRTTVQSPEGAAAVTAAKVFLGGGGREGARPLRPVGPEGGVGGGLGAGCGGVRVGGGGDCSRAPVTGDGGNKAAAVVVEMAMMFMSPVLVVACCKPT